MKWWEINAIIRGYRQRKILQYQLQRLQAYYSFFSMRDNKDGMTPLEFLPMYFDEEDEYTPPEIDKKQIQEEMAALGLV